MSATATRRDLVARVYGEDRADDIAERVESVVQEATPAQLPTRRPWSVDDVWLITYADQFRSGDEPPLRTLGRVYDTRLADHLNGVHILPFYPWTSDDGFSVADYEAVAPEYGDWGDVTALTRRAEVMFDAVINHMSAQSGWFQAFLAGDPEYEGFFATAGPDDDLTTVVRPRTHPLLTPFEARDGTVDVWTTFSADQVDLDYGNPSVMLRILEVLLDYARRGAGAIRLDAVGFLWKEPGTSSLHLPQTHALIQLYRACLDETYPNVKLITETNVPHAENVSYFGDGRFAEAQAVYQFPMPPLVLHSFVAGDASILSRWAATIAEPLRPGLTYFNFLSSHDGVGLRPLEGVLDEDQRRRLLEVTATAGGEVSMRSLPDGSEAPYELNSTWFDLMAAGHDVPSAIRRHLSSHAIAFSLPGIVGLYVHSLFGTGNDREGYRRTGQKRTLNRRRFALEDLETALSDPSSTAHVVYRELNRLIALRRSSPAFAPEADHVVLDAGSSLFAVERFAGPERARVYVDVSGSGATVPLDGTWYDMESGELLAQAVVDPFSSCWIRSTPLPKQVESV